MNIKFEKCRVITLDEAKVKGLDPHEIMGIEPSSYERVLSGITTNVKLYDIDEYGWRWYSSDDFRGFRVVEYFIDFENI